jgi:hypothetical protein
LAPALTASWEIYKNVFLDDRIVYYNTIKTHKNHTPGVKTIDPVCGVNVTDRILTDNNGYFPSSFLGNTQQQNGMISEYLSLARFVAAVGLAGIAIAVCFFSYALFWTS